MGGCVPVVIHRRAELDLPDSDDDANNNNNNNNNKNTNNPYPINEVKLYHHTNSKWVVEEELVELYYLRAMLPDYDSDDWDWERERDSDDDDDSDDGKQYEYDIEKEEPIPDYYWALKIGLKVEVKIDYNLQLKAFKDQKRVDFVADGVWAVKFYSEELYDNFIKRYQLCLFENTFMYRANDENMLKVYGKDFIGWAKPETVDDSMWEESLMKCEEEEDRGQDFTEVFEEAAAMDGASAIQSLAMGALDNSFLVSNSGIQVVRNYSHGIQGKGIYVNFDDGRSKVGVNSSYSTPKKALLMRAETNMLLMSPMDEGEPHSKGLHQLDIETGSIVREWKFEKDGADISMRDITNDSKGAQIDPSGSTFLGLDDNRLCRWDMRDRKGVVQNLVNESTPVLNWTEGHQFSTGTNFQCFATTGDGSIVVGSLDGKIRLYSVSSMSQDKTAFPGLGLPITHVDVTYDGKWILGTTDTYLILICTLSTDKDGNTKTGFTSGMGNRIAAPRLLKLTPIDSHMAGANKFHDAQFSWVTENGKQERHLVATVGKLSVIWNFQQVKDGSHQCYQNQVGFKSCYCYKIVHRDDSIVESRFMHEKFLFSDSPESHSWWQPPRKLVLSVYVAAACTCKQIHMFTCAPTYVSYHLLQLLL